MRGRGDVTVTAISTFSIALEFSLISKVLESPAVVRNLAAAILSVPLNALAALLRLLRAVLAAHVNSWRDRVRRETFQSGKQYSLLSLG